MFSKVTPKYFVQNTNTQVETLTIYFNPEGTLASMFDLPELRSSKMFMQQHQQGFKVPLNISDDVSQLMIGIKNASGFDQLINFLTLLKDLPILKPG